MRTTRSSCISTLNEQPTPQYAQVVVATRSGRPAWITVFSVSATVGHASTQAPHDTHSDAMNGSFWLAATFEPNPRPWTLNAPAPVARADAPRADNAHRRIEREIRLLVSFGASWWLRRPRNAPVTSSPATFCNSQ
jgi:hypothetical protein